MPVVQKSFVFNWVGNLLLKKKKKKICALELIVATLDWLVRSSYLPLHGNVNLIQILQGGLVNQKSKYIENYILIKE